MYHINDFYLCSCRVLYVYEKWIEKKQRMAVLHRYVRLVVVTMPEFALVLFCREKHESASIVVHSDIFYAVEVLMTVKASEQYKKLLHQRDLLLYIR